MIERNCPKNSCWRTSDLVTQAASQGLSENEIGCARISMMARSITLRARAGYVSARESTATLNSWGGFGASPSWSLALVHALLQVPIVVPSDQVKHFLR